MDADVGVIGVGTMGSMTMWQLAKRGVKVIGFEQFGIGHDRAGAGGESRLFRTAYKEGAEYVPMLQAAYQEWRKLEAESGNKLLTLSGALMIGNPDSTFMKNVLESIEEYQLDHEIFNADDAAERYPQHRLLPGEMMVLDKMGGFLRPEYAVVSAVKRVRELGAYVHRHSKIERIEPNDDGVTIHTTSGETYQVGKVIIATGAWTGKLMPDIRQETKINRIKMTWFPPKKREDFIPENFPIFSRKSGDVECYGAPSLDGTTVKVSFTYKHDDVEDPDYLNRSVDLAHVPNIDYYVEKFFPGLYPDPVRISAYMDLYTPDKHPILGEVPGFKNTIVVSGFSGHGFKMSPIIGKMTADIALDGKTQFQIDRFSPSKLFA